MGPYGDLIINLNDEERVQPNRPIKFQLPEMNVRFLVTFLSRQLSQNLAHRRGENFKISHNLFFPSNLVWWYYCRPIWRSGPLGRCFRGRNGQRWVLIFGRGGSWVLKNRLFSFLNIYDPPSTFWGQDRKKRLELFFYTLQGITTPNFRTIG